MKAGITPAWAGKSSTGNHLVRLTQDHPRVGGEKCMTLICTRPDRGSPPRGRGKVSFVVLTLSVIGITPAWAGKRRAASSRRSVRRDHPRVGGEKGARRPVFPCRSGSPPRGRGKVLAGDKPVPLIGITPAWAGKRLKRSHRSGIFISGPIPFHSVLHRPAGSGGSRAGRDGSPAGQLQNTGPA